MWWIVACVGCTLVGWAAGTAMGAWIVNYSWTKWYDDMKRLFSNSKEHK